MYEDDQSEPIFLTPWTDAGLLRSYEYQKLKRGEDPIQRALEQLPGLTKGLGALHGWCQRLQILFS